MARPSNRDTGVYGPIKAFSYLSGSAPADNPTSTSPRNQDHYHQSEQEATLGLDDEIDDAYGQSRTSLGLNRRSTYYPPERKTGTQAPTRQDQYRSRNPGQDPRYQSHIEVGDSRNRGQTNHGSDFGSDADARSGVSRDRFPQSPENHPSLFDNFILRDPEDSQPQKRFDDRSDRRMNYPVDPPGPPSGGLGRSYEDRTYRPPQDQDYTSRNYLDLESDAGYGDEHRRDYDPYRYDRDQRDTGRKVEDPYKYNRQLPRTELPSSPDPRSNHPKGLPLPDQPQARRYSDDIRLDSNGYNKKGKTARPNIEAGDMNTYYRKSTTNGADRKSKCLRRCKWAFIIIVVAVLALGAGFVAAWFSRPLYDESKAAADTTPGALGGMITASTVASTNTDNSELSTNIMMTNGVPPTTVAVTTQNLADLSTAATAP